MDIIFHSHHADVSEAMQKRAVRAVERAAERIPRIVEGTVRFEEDGPMRRVVVTLRAPKHHELVGRAEGRYFGPALRSAIARILAQASKERANAGHNGARRRGRKGHSARARV